MFLNKDSEYITELTKDGIREFARNMIMQFDDVINEVPVHFAGSPPTGSAPGDMVLDDFTALRKIGIGLSAIYTRDHIMLKQATFGAGCFW